MYFKDKRILSKYIKNGRVDNVYKLSNYLKCILSSIIRIKYYFILDINLNNSEVFAYKYAFEHAGFVNYEVINDLDIMKNYLTMDNILVMSWNSSANMAYITCDEIVVCPFNLNIVNSLDKKYILLVGDKGIPKTKLDILIHEDNQNNIFNYLK